MDQKIKFVLTIVIGAALIVFFFWATQTIYKLTGHAITDSAINLSQSEADNLAKCLSEKGIKMYGSNECSACSYQKQLFGSSFQYIDFVECTESPELCQGITGYPTWKSADKELSRGAQPLNKLKSLAGC